MNIEDLVRSFRDGATRGTASGRRVRIEGNLLINYDTVIAERVDGGVRLNTRKYSSTTSRLQNRIARICNVVEEFEGDRAYIYYGW